MDVANGKFEFDVHTGQIKAEGGRRAALDPSIFGEGYKVPEVDSNVAWNPPPVKPVMPDWSQIKSIRKYFGRTEMPFWPAWFYHPVEKEILCSEEQAAALGVRRREATFEEKGRYGIQYAWEYADGCLWRGQPYPQNRPGKFNPLKPDHGKTYVPAAPNPVHAQNALLSELIPTVTAAVVTALKSGGQAGAPANIDPAQWQEFLAFQAWKQTALALTPDDETDRPLRRPETPHESAMKAALHPERAEWEEAANRIGLKVDGRWSLDRLKTEVEKKAAELEAQGTA